MFADDRLRLMFLLAVLSSFGVNYVKGQTNQSKHSASVDEQANCDHLRLQMTSLFRQIFEQKLPAKHISELLPLWVESSLPKNCMHQEIALFNSSSSKFDKGGPLGTLGLFNSIHTMSVKTKRSAEEEFDKNMGHNRQKRGVGTIGDAGWGVPAQDFVRNKRSAETKSGSGDQGLHRQKRFTVGSLGGMSGSGMLGGGMFGGGMLGGGMGSLGGGMDPTGTPREVSETELIMNTLLMFSNMQKAYHTRQLRTKEAYVPEKPSLKNGMYGDHYFGRRKRETGPLSRQKRFLFGPSEPGEPGANNPLFDIYGMLTGTATDPQTGKPVEFGGDVMKNMMTNTFISTLPLSAQPPPGKEPPEIFKHMAPMWYMNMYERLLNPMPYRSRPALYRSYTPPQRQTHDGYFGDTLPGKRRKKRSSVSDNVVYDETSRLKRQVEEVKIDGPTQQVPPKPATFYGGNVYYGDAYIPNTQPASYHQALHMFRDLLQRNQRLKQQLEKQQEQQRLAPYAAYGNAYPHGPLKEIPPADRNNIPLQVIPQRQSFPPIHFHATDASSRRGMAIETKPLQTPPPLPPKPRVFVDPFILQPAAIPTSQALDPFIPLPTTTPATTTTDPTPEPGRKKRSANEETSRERVKRADKSKGNDSPFVDFIIPPPFFNTLISPNGHLDPFSSFGHSNHHGSSSRQNQNGQWTNNQQNYQGNIRRHYEPERSSYIASNGDVIYGDLPAWSARIGSRNSRV